MPVNKVAMQVNLRKNENENNRGYGKYYFEMDRKKTLSLRGFAQHLTDHGSIFTRDVVEGVLKKITECLPELCSQGIPVEIEPLGTFYCSVHNKKNGLTKQQVIDGTYDINDQIIGVSLNFLPYGVKDEELTSKKFKEQFCTFEIRDVIKSRKETDQQTGKIRRYKEATPFDTWIHDESQPEP